ncbi:FAD-binding protein [Azospirillum thermophilum]|uniref:FAD-binding protein n=1 Tax=Azospirillum thermophilum TaxID=2202148 RepID=UPI0024820217|nr:FAD-binding protein [Azospirillum thermophilum]
MEPHGRGGRAFAGHGWRDRHAARRHGAGHRGGRERPPLRRRGGGDRAGPLRRLGERLLHRQPAYLLFDSRIEQRFAPPLYPPIRAGSVAALARQLDLDPATLEETVRTFNAAIRPGATPLDSRTVGLAPDKSRLAQPLATPPFGAIPMRPGITSTNQGVRVDRRTRILTTAGVPLPGLYAAGVVMAPNILGRGYLAGGAMTIGAVFGRIAGREAAAHALA